MATIIRISVDQISDDALAALGGACLDDLVFGLDVNSEAVYCVNEDDRLASVWNRETSRWDHTSLAAYRAASE